MACVGQATSCCLQQWRSGFWHTYASLGLSESIADISCHLRVSTVYLYEFLSTNFKRLTWIYSIRGTVYMLTTFQNYTGIGYISWKITNPIMALHNVKYIINTLRPRQHGLHFQDDILKWIFLNGYIRVRSKCHQTLFLGGKINKTAVLVQMVAWRQAIVWTNDS